MNQKLMMSNWFPGFSHQWRLFESKSVHLFSWQLLRLPNINVYSIIIRITTTCFVFYFRVFGTERGFWELEALKVECTREGGGRACGGVWYTVYSKPIQRYLSGFISTRFCLFTNIFRRLWLKTEIKTLQTLLFELIKAFLVRAKV